MLFSPFCPQASLQFHLLPAIMSNHLGDVAHCPSFHPDRFVYPLVALGSQTPWKRYMLKLFLKLLLRKTLNWTAFPCRPSLRVICSAELHRCSCSESPLINTALFCCVDPISFWTGKLTLSTFHWVLHISAQSSCMQMLLSIILPFLWFHDVSRLFKKDTMQPWTQMYCNPPTSAPKVLGLLSLTCCFALCQETPGGILRS